MNRQILVQNIQNALIRGATKYAEQEAAGFVQLAWLKENLPTDFPELEKYLNNAEKLGYNETDFEATCGYSATSWTGWLFVRLKNDILGYSRQQKIDLPLTATLSKDFITPLLEAEKKAKAAKQEKYEKKQLENKVAGLERTLACRNDSISDLENSVEEMEAHIKHLESVISGLEAQNN